MGKYVPVSYNDSFLHSNVFRLRFSQCVECDSLTVSLFTSKNTNCFSLIHTEIEQRLKFQKHKPAYSLQEVTWKDA